MDEIPSRSKRALMGLAGLAICSLPRSVFAANKITDKPSAIEQPAQQIDKVFIDRAFSKQREAIANGDQGYGAVVVRDGLIVGQSSSKVVSHNDPTAHAEMEAIRDAAARLESRNLSGCILFSSSRACSMCEAAAYWANIDRMVYGKTATDAGRPGLC